MKLITCVVLAVITAAVPASAQSIQSAGSTDFSGVRLKGLPTVYVMDRQGQEIKGKVVSWTDSAIVLRIDDGATRTFKAGEAIRIDLRGDSLKNGALIGAGVGLGLGLLSGGFADCPGSSEGCAGTRVALVFLSTAMYAAIGTAIDALIPGRTPLWNASSKTGGGLTFNVSPRNRSAFVGWRFH